MTNTLTPVERAAIEKVVADKQGFGPHEIQRWRERLYLRIFISFYVLEGDEFVRFTGAFPNKAFEVDTVRVRWESEIDSAQV